MIYLKILFNKKCKRYQFQDISEAKKRIFLEKNTYLKIFCHIRNIPPFPLDKSMQCVYHLSVILARECAGHKSRRRCNYAENQRKLRDHFYRGRKPR